jgi:hypothetical protein
MNWEAIGAIGEILGAVVVVATLFYLSNQLRQNANALQRNNEYAHNESIHHAQRFHHDVFAVLASDSELSSIHRRCLAGEDLTPDEAHRFAWFVNSYLVFVEFAWRQQGLELGFVEENEESIIQLTGPHIRKLLGTNAGSEWWRSTGPELFFGDFVEKIDRVIAENADVAV